MDLREHDDISGTGLNRLFSDLLNHIVANDSKSTRADDRLDNMCNMLLLKMDSDTNGKMLKTPKSLLTSRFARHRWKPQKESIQTLKGTWRNTLSSSKTHQRKPSNSMMRRFIHRLLASRHQLKSAAPETLSTAFQVFRSANVKQGEGQYFTPQRIIESAVKLMEIDYHDKVIDQLVVPADSCLRLIALC